MIEVPSESSQVQAILETAQRRNVLIPSLEGRVYTKANPLKTKALQALAWRHIKSYDVYGAEHIAEAERLVSSGERLTVTAYHESDGDHPFFRYLLSKAGFASFADRVVYLAGLKMEEREQIKHFTDTEAHIFIVTPFDRRKLKEALALKGLPEDVRNILVQYKENCAKLSRWSNEAANTVAKEGKVITFYPQSTRKRVEQHPDEVVAPEDIAVNFEYDGWILPVMVEGAALVSPPDGFYQPFAEVHATMGVGKPYPTSELWNRSLSRRDQYQQCAGIVMERIMAAGNRAYTPSLRGTRVPPWDY